MLTDIYLKMGDEWGKGYETTYDETRQQQLW